jgi:SAM-dependent methyltransferase
MYKNLATLYDEFINVPYETWAYLINGTLKKQNAKLVLDLACGTGTLTGLLSQYGYDMIAIDNSEEMLMIAKDKLMESSILFLKQDMRSFELYGTVDAIICTCDSLNYILKEDELKQVFSLVKNYLNPNGIFIFDVKTEDFFKNLEPKTTFESDKGVIFWETNYDEKTKINEYFLNIFVKTPNGLYERSEEHHLQKVHPKMELFLRISGLETIRKYNGYSKDDGRKIYICKVL